MLNVVHPKSSLLLNAVLGISGTVVIAFLCLALLRVYLIQQTGISAAKAVEEKSVISTDAAINKTQWTLQWLPDEPILWYRLAQLYKTRGQSEQEIAALTRAVRLDSENLIIGRDLAIAFEAAGQFDKARQQWQSIGVDETSFIEFGRQLLVAGDIAQAKMWFDRASQLNVELGDSDYYRGLVAQEEHNLDQALHYYELALTASAFSSVGRSDVLTRLALLYQYSLHVSQPERAFEHFNAAIADNSFTINLLAATAYYERGTYFERGEQFADAIAAYEAALALRPNHNWAQLRLGRAIYMAHDDLARAETTIQQAIAIWPQGNDLRFAYIFLGDIYRDAGRIDQAIIAYEKALQLDPNNQDVQQMLAELTEE